MRRASCWLGLLGLLWTVAGCNCVTVYVDAVGDPDASTGALRRFAMRQMNHTDRRTQLLRKRVVSLVKQRAVGREQVLEDRIQLITARDDELRAKALAARVR